MARIIVETEMGQRFDGTLTGEVLNNEGDMTFRLTGTFDDGQTVDLSWGFNLDDSDAPDRRPHVLSGTARGREVLWNDPDQSNIDHPNWAEWCLFWDIKCAHDAVESVFADG